MAKKGMEITQYNIMGWRTKIKVQEGRGSKGYLRSLLINDWMSHLVLTIHKIV